MSKLPGEHATELNPQDQAAWDASTREMDTLAQELLAGDASGLESHLTALKTPSVDMTRVLNALHVPQDAGEMQSDLVNILRRIPDGWGRWIGCGKGWYVILIETDAALSTIDPDYEVHQVKEKYGRLCYFYGSTLEYDSLEQRQMDVIVDAAEERSIHTCESCGGPGLMMASFGWYATLCYVCAALSQKGYHPAHLSKEHPHAALLDLVFDLPFAISTYSHGDFSDEAQAAQSHAATHLRAFERWLDLLLGLGDLAAGWCRHYDGRDLPIARYQFLLTDEAAATTGLAQLKAALASPADAFAQAGLVSSTITVPPPPLISSYETPSLLTLVMDTVEVAHRPGFTHWLIAALSILPDNLTECSDLPNGDAQWQFVLASPQAVHDAIHALRIILDKTQARGILHLALLGNPPVEI